MKSLLLSVVLFASAVYAATPFDEAENATFTRDQAHVRDLYAKAAESDPDPRRRDEARIREARIDWYVFHDAARARTALAKIGDASLERSAAYSEQSRMECELTHDFNAARSAADLALASAKKAFDRDNALTRWAFATIEESRLQRHAGKCPARTTLDQAIGKLKSAVEGNGPTIERSQELLDAALMAHDDPTALQAWRWYDSDLPALVPASMNDRRAAGLALATARLFPEAEIVLADPCAEAPIPKDPEVQDVLAYATAMRRGAALVAEHHRSVALGTADDKAFTQALGGQSVALWNALSWPATPPTFSPEAAQREYSKRFGAVATLGKTDGIFSILYGHRVSDTTREVEQHGHRGTLHFIQLDGMMSDGFAAWATHGVSGTGGWIGSDAVYQVRPMYVDGPIRLWRGVADPAERARVEDEIRRESDRDRERVKGDAVAALTGLTLRLRHQYADRLRERLASQGLQGDALRDTFLRTASIDTLASSIWAHEGRHSIDKGLGIKNDVDLEFFAKLSEIAFAPGPRGSMGSILEPVGGKGAHAEANERVLKGVVAWMRAHAAQIEGFDPTAATLPQLDRLTDEQLKDAFRSLDPLAH